MRLYMPVCRRIASYMSDNAQIIIYYVGNTEQWITLRLVTFIADIQTADWTTPLGIAGIEIPAWLKELRRLAGIYSRLLDNVGNTGIQGLPTVACLNDVLPKVIDSGFSFPSWNPLIDEGNLVITSEFVAQMVSPPWKARLTTWKWRGFHFWAGSRGLSARLSYVASALLYYRRADLERIPYPGLNLEGMFPGCDLSSGTLLYSPSCRGNETTGEPLFFAQTKVLYSYPGYIVDNYWYLCCPYETEPPYWHFLSGLRPRMKPVVSSSGAGVRMPGLVSTYVIGDNLDIVPSGCNVDFPGDECLGKYDLSLYTGYPPTLMVVKAGNDYKNGYGNYSGWGSGEDDTSVGGVVIITEVEPGQIDKGLPESMSIISTCLRLLSLPGGQGGKNNALLIGGEEVSIGGLTLAVTEPV